MTTEIKVNEGSEITNILSEKELVIFPKWLESFTYKEISDYTSRKEETTKTHVKHIIQKIHVKDKCQALALSVARGWVSIKEVGGSGLFAICLTLGSSFFDDDNYRTGRIARPQITRSKARES